MKNLTMAEVAHLLGAVSVRNPEAYSYRSRSSIKYLLSHMLYKLGEAERRDADGLPSSLVREDAATVARVIRVLLRPECVDVVEEEANR